VRLTNIKLAGFKSFVDPTNIGVPGNLVGVVGPNGCGKSNIIDAVRWVLGESRASALRGESMQDVIFNGSSQRKPVARASVELVFDNALGKAAGQWSQYAEISVKRILTREGDSSYWINNTQVRRRDVQDIFLGTGVGPRAYAIIEQGMISRVIEAKPEDLRVFLEEAAGVSKYKERRKETENRLEDTRENLARVDDIRRELDSQIEKLRRQAEVAREYQTLKTEQDTKQQLLWLMRKRDAEAESSRLNAEVERVVNEVEAGTARLREIELRLEVTRTEHYDAGDAVNSAQGVLYGVNSEVSRLEAELKFISDTRTRLHTQGVQLVGQLAQWGRQSSELAEALNMWRGRREHLIERRELANEQVVAQADRMPEFEQALREAQGRTQAARDRIVDVQRSLQLEEAHRANAAKTIDALRAREGRLDAELGALAAPDLAEIARLGAQLAGFDAQLARLDDELQVLTATLPALESARAASAAEAQRLERESTHLAGRLTALEKIQSRVDENEPVDRWLDRRGLAALPRLWQAIEVEPGWEAAVESVLRERLHAVALADDAALDALLADAPSARLTLFSPDAASIAHAPRVVGEGRPLAGLIRYRNDAVRGLVEEWLDGHFAVTATPTAETRLALAPGMVLVDAAGNHFRRHAVSFYAPDDGDAGILGRQREIEGLRRELEEARAALAVARAAFEADEAGLKGASGRAAQLRASTNDARQARHRIELEHLRLVQADERVRDRRTAIEAERGELVAEREAEADRAEQLALSLETLNEQLLALREQFDGTQGGQQAAERAVADQRQAIQAAEREAQEAAFAVRECESKIGEVDRQLRAMLEQMAAATQQERSLRDELGALQDAGLRERLQELLTARVSAEESLALARDKHEGLTATLRGTEEERLATEQTLGPLRERISELRLKEQAARLAFEQFSMQLLEAAADEAKLLDGIEKAPRPQTLQADINRLAQQVAALGPINMAALGELDTSEERKGYLDSQATDLAEALATLESAIRRIDLETRELLQKTFDEVNQNFSSLFPSLFGGGQAKLVMTGEEVLDAGVQVMAQPPGKKNQSIHLLSGGEKALTATALIFALFQLNPAPFCLLDEVDAPLDDTNTERFCNLVRRMSQQTQFLFISHSKITMELAQQLIGVTMQEQGVSRIVAVDIEEALRLREAA
jgi:chromosome segregation protein